MARLKQSATGPCCWKASSAFTGLVLFAQILLSIAFQIHSFPIRVLRANTRNYSTCPLGTTRMQHWRSQSTDITDATTPFTYDADFFRDYSQSNANGDDSVFNEGRRTFLSNIATVGILAMAPPQSFALNDQDNQSTEITLESQYGSPLGIQLKEVKKSDGTTVLLVQSASETQRANGIQNGMILENFSSYSELQRLIQAGPYPLRLRFVASDYAFLSNLGSDSIYKIITTEPSPAQMCSLQSKRDDVLEINYEAKFVKSDGPVLLTYDSSASRGTGQPYQTVLGSGDMLPGVDQGLYDMCIGEKRRLIIPSPLAYGPKGSKIFRISPDQTLIWDVELVAINGERTP